MIIVITPKFTSQNLKITTPKEIFTPSKKDDKQNKEPQCSTCGLLLEKMDQLIASVNAMEKKLKQKDINEQKLMSKINDLEEQLGILKENENSAKSTEAVISTNIDDWKNMIEERIEENTNRQLRKTMVYYNVAESIEEKNWDETEETLSSKIAEVLKIDKGTVSNMIDRCHRVPY